MPEFIRFYIEFVSLIPEHAKEGANPVGTLVEILIAFLPLLLVLLVVLQLVQWRQDGRLAAKRRVAARQPDARREARKEAESTAWERYTAECSEQELGILLRAIKTSGGRVVTSAPVGRGYVVTYEAPVS